MMKIKRPLRNPVTLTQTSSAPSPSLERTGCAGHASSHANHPGGLMRNGDITLLSQGGGACWSILLLLFLFFIECLLVFI